MNGTEAARALPAARKKVLLVSESVTLAQIVRLVELGRALDPARYEVVFASGRFPDIVFDGIPWRQVPIWTLSDKQVTRALASGRRLHSKRTLARYVREELELLEREKPDLVVGDFRLSLTISAPVSGVPFASFINAYWSPYARRDAFPLPDHPIVRLLGEDMAAKYFPRALPAVFRHFAAPVNALRRRYGLAPVGGLLEALTHGDWTLYPDVAELTPTENLPASHRYLGPVIWSPRMPLPSWWDDLDPSKPTVYVTLGSSGKIALLPRVVEALSGQGVNVLLATAGRVQRDDWPAGFFVADYLPGDVAAARSDLVLCNGGSATVYQALNEGVPVLGLPWNLDHYLTMSAVLHAGAGAQVRAGSATAAGIADATGALLRDPAAAAAAQRVRAAFAARPAAPRFRALVEEATSSHSLAHGDLA